MVTVKGPIGGNMEDSIAESIEECKTEPMVFIEVYEDHENYQNEIEMDNTLTTENISIKKESEGADLMEELELHKLKQIEKNKNKIISHDETSEPLNKSRTEQGTSFTYLDGVQIKSEPKCDDEEEAETETEIPGVSIKMEDFEEIEESSDFVIKVEKFENFDEDDKYSDETDDKQKSNRRDVAIACTIDENSSDNCPFNECLKCSKFESDLSSMLKHDCIKKANSGECVICESISKQVSDMKFHLNMAHDNIVRPVTEPHFPYPFECKWCSKTFATEYRLGVHKFIHRLIKTYKCRKCDKKFVKFESVVKHELLHPDLVNFPREAEYLGQLFSCSACELKFSTPQLLADHKTIHESYLCSQCRMMFTKKSTLAEHIKTKHVGKSKKKYECSQCKRLCQNALTLKRHVRVVHKALSDLS